MILFAANTLASQLVASPLFRSGVGLVHSGVSVVGPNGRPLSGLFSGGPVSV